MNRAPDTVKHQIYPARYFTASPTWFTWNKLTAADIHALRTERGFEGQNVYFHLNHPIRFIRLVAPVVAIDDINPKYTILTLDDGSGATIEVKIVRLAAAVAQGSTRRSNTEVDNTTIRSTLGTFEVLIDGAPVDIGTVIKAKCTISTFRQVRQLELQRVSVVRDTNEEARAWAELAEFKERVLAKPWSLTEQEMKEIDESIRAERSKEREREMKRKEVDAKNKEKRRRHDEKAERRRRREEVDMAVGALL
ncbi:hypothetical protein LTR28_012438 [Elasticomyces elasticus]|nr:hypothetical protein LTR28_012438 [Elasticomyces elasticus]